MRGRSALVSLAGALAIALCPRPSAATDCSGVLSPCINDDTLWPHAGPSLFEAIGDTDTVAGGQLGFGLVSTYLSRPIVLHVKSPGGGGSDQYVVNDQVNGAFLWSYGVTDRFELDVALPLTFGQSGAGLSPVTGGDGLRDTAQRDMRFGFAYAIVPRLRVDPDLASGSALARHDAWGLAARLDVSAPTGDQSQFAGEHSAVFAPTLAADYRRGRWFFGAEVGARVRPTVQLLQARVGSQIEAALGVGLRVLPRELLSAQIEAWALPALVRQADITRSGDVYASQPNSAALVPAEWQLSARTAPVRGGDLSIQIGGGGAMPLSGDSATTAPRFRFMLGVRWAPLRRDTDGDGVPDTTDKCPSTPASGTEDGCPARALPDGPTEDFVGPTQGGPKK
jgi:OOP family OmpA-OmpF porin